MTWRVFTYPGYVIGSGLRPGELRRILITLNGTDANYTLENPIVETGDFVHKIEFALSSLTGDLVLYGSDDVTDDYFRIDATNGGFDWQVGGAFFAHDGTFTPDLKLHTVIFSRTGVTAKVNLDGVDIIDAGINTSPFTIKALSKRDNDTNFFDGIIANPDFGNGNAWQLNRLTANTEQSSSGNNLLTYVNIDADARELFTFNQSEAPNGWDSNVDLWANPPSLVGTQWTDNGNGNYSYIGDGSFNVLQNTTIAETTRKIKFDCLAITGTMKVDNPGQTLLTFSAVDNYTVIGTINASPLVGFARDGASVATATIANISDRRFIQIA